MARDLRLEEEVLLKEMVLFRALIVTEQSHHATQPLSKLKGQIE